MKEGVIMKVGFATLDITPKSPVYMAGYSRKGKSHGILDEILIGTIVLEIKNIKILWIIIDSIMLEKDFCDSLKEKIYQLYAIEMNKIFISCIHTHSAPAYFKLTWEDTIVEKELQTKLFEQCLETVNHALSHLISCTLTLKKTWIEGLYGNRNEKDGWSDKSLYVLEFVHDHQPVCQLINISVHPTILNGSNFLLSSDLLGMIRQKYQQLTGIKTFICNGATGDVSTRFYRQSSGIDE